MKLRKGETSYGCDCGWHRNDGKRVYDDVNIKDWTGTIMHFNTFSISFPVTPVSSDGSSHSNFQMPAPTTRVEGPLVRSKTLIQTWNCKIQAKCTKAYTPFSSTCVHIIKHLYCWIASYLLKVLQTRVWLKAQFCRKSANGGGIPNWGSESLMEAPKFSVSHRKY